MKEWVKYRYGVFDEQGFAGDPLYPIFYEKDRKILPTGSVNTMLTGSWIYSNGSSLCDPTTEDCYFKPEGHNKEVTCSLNYVPFLENVRGWCDEVAGPSKHGVLCQGRSVLQVIFSHPDFNSRSPRSVMETMVTTPFFDVVRQPKPKYVILIETSNSMSSIWKWVRKSLQAFVKYELPDNTEIGIVSFNSDSEVRHRMSYLARERVRTRLGDSIPENAYRLSKTDDRCVVCGVREAMEKLLRGKEAGSHLIILTQGDESSLSKEGQEILTEYSLYHGVRISSLLLPVKSKPTLDFYSKLAKSSGGLSKSIDVNSLDMLECLTRSLIDAVTVDTPKPALLSVTVHKDIIHGRTWNSKGNFIIDETLGRKTLFGVYVEDAENHQIKSITLTDQEGSVYGPYTKMSSALDGINLKTINFPIGQKLPFDEVRFRA